MYETIVVIPTFISHPLRYRLFDQLWHDQGVGKVLVVDNGNSFGVPDKKQRTWSKIQVLRPGVNLNWLRACNYGAKEALRTGMPYVTFLNDDVSLSRNYFLELIEAFRANENVGLLTSLYNEKFCLPAYCDKSVHGWRPQAVEREIAYTDGTIMFMPRETLTDVGLLDETFADPGWGADSDYGYRVRQEGKRVLVTHRAMLWHKGGVTGDHVYGGREQRISRGCRQMSDDLERKYGTEWRRLLEL